MKKQTLHQDWRFAPGTLTLVDLFLGGDRVRRVDLPHDAMVERQRDPDTANGHQTGFYPGGTYTYLKQWQVPQSWAGQTVLLQFEGIADRGRLYLNGERLATSVNPYGEVLLDLTGRLHAGVANELRVEVLSEEQSSRWYSGAGLYRPVNVWVGGPACLPPDGMRITTETLTARRAVIHLELSVRNRLRNAAAASLAVTLWDPAGKAVAKETLPLQLLPGQDETPQLRLSVADPQPWSAETPSLYRCTAQLTVDGAEMDRAELPFGLRTLALVPGKGLLVNGQEVKLRGACIHHDNGVLGAATFADAERRRCRQLKKAGFNCLRSAHHPMSRAMLQACDELGMYVLDELSDVWTRGKNPRDYAQFFPDRWQQDVAQLVRKDYNHPSVLIYVTGNEIPEIGTPAGTRLARALHAAFRQADPTRFTTCALNGLVAGADRMGEMLCQATGMTSEQLSALQQPAAGGESAGSDAANGMAMVMQGPLADAIATGPIMDELLEKAAAATDITGYNYLTARHERDLARHPDRMILGTETFPADIVRLWRIVEGNPQVLGDMTWAGYDYLGEAGCGIFHYNGVANFSSHWPDRLAGIGDLDILGTRKPISYLRQAVYRLGHAPAIGVLRPDRDAAHCTRTPWMWKDNIASWTWPGCEGQPTSVDVYANADEAELFLNEKSLGRKPLQDFAATWELPYTPGTLTAVSYLDRAEAGRTELVTTEEPAALALHPDRTGMPADGQALTFVRIRPVDGQDRWNRFVPVTVTVEVTGAGTLQGLGSANPSCEGSYLDSTWTTYDGEVMAVLRAGTEPGLLTLTVTTPGLPRQTLTITVESASEDA